MGAAEPEQLRNEQYKDASRLDARIALHRDFSVNRQGWTSWLFEQLEIRDRADLLELGCGPASVWVDNAHRIPSGWQVCLSDFSAGMLAEAEERLTAIQHSFAFQVIDALAIPMPDESFDCVLANHMLYHVPDRPRALAEICRVLRPGGLLFASTLSGDTMQEMGEVVRAVTARKEFRMMRMAGKFKLDDGEVQLAPFFEEIETRCYENIRPAFLRVNPAGTVPVLLHRGHPVYESHEQIRYAAMHAPAGSPRLVPEDPDLRAEMEGWIDRSSLTEDPLAHGDASAGNAVPGLTVPLFAAMIDRVALWKIAEGLLFHIDKRRPLAFLALKVWGLKRLAHFAPLVRAVARSRRQLGVHLDALEEQLDKTGGPWILGDGFSLADVSWVVIFERLAQVDNLHVFLDAEEGRRPACSHYWTRLRARPSYRAAIVEQSHPTIAHGTGRLREATAADPGLREALEGSAD